VFRTLISPENLAAHVADPAWVIFDCRHDLANLSAGRTGYAAGHIRGARFADVEHDLAGAKNGRNGRHPLPAIDDFLSFLRAAGVDESSQVVAYDAQGGIYAARLWWMLNWIGHPRVAVLDGGLPRWLSEGRPVSQELPATGHGSIRAQAVHWPSADAAAVESNLSDARHLVIDARAPERYRGETEPLDRVAGHIPGALNRFYQRNLNAEGRFKPAHDLRAEFQELVGTSDPTQIIHSCGSGVTACHNLLAMEIAGLHGSALYPGSWSEWSSDPARPVAQG
jgi:thiosulfate/3-mercaptopyruvate sulfurtransferase